MGLEWDYDKWDGINEIWDEIWMGWDMGFSQSHLYEQQNNNALLETCLEYLSKIVQILIKIGNTEGFGITILLEKSNKLLAEITKYICKQFENEDGYKWNDYKNSNRKRMECYKLSDEVKAEIKKNKYLDSLQLCNYLSIQFDMNPIKLVIGLLDKEYCSKECILLIAKSTNTLTAIGFITLFLNKLKDIKEIHIDVTYKIAKGRFELYGIIGKKYGIGFVLGYLILDVIGELESTKTMILTEFLLKFKELKFESEYIFTD
ncbi:hypothetical protein RhiirA4_477588 [Rhizophagus irregularis]|uniref:Uncharacterized protein n=1 Tax=Rhizophagus irregularis TaxID=588596 RepID=A0A2I1HDH3_9GLOM|nr:hypothetical protein RhiirA4_477588 [Rhizophagus irregularis]